MTLVVELREVPGRPVRLLVVVHGYQANERDMAWLPPIIDPEHRFQPMHPRAPLDTTREGSVAWYHRDDWGRIDAEQFLSSLAALDRTVDEVCDRQGMARSDAVYVGFSQGAGVALALGLARGIKVRPAGVAALSGVLPVLDGLDYAFECTDLPAILIQHGTWDSHIAVEEGHRARDVLQEHGVKHEYQEFDRGHGLCSESLVELQAWLARL